MSIRQSVLRISRLPEDGDLNEFTTCIYPKMPLRSIAAQQRAKGRVPWTYGNPGTVSIERCCDLVSAL
jgi:hypothetical protein